MGLNQVIQVREYSKNRMLVIHFFVEDVGNTLSLLNSISFDYYVYIKVHV